VDFTPAIVEFDVIAGSGTLPMDVLKLMYVGCNVSMRVDRSVGVIEGATVGVILGRSRGVNGLELGISEGGSKRAAKVGKPVGRSLGK
jgi:hypothetical protein